MSRGKRRCREAEGTRSGLPLAVVVMAEEAMQEPQGYMDSRKYHKWCI